MRPLLLLLLAACAPVVATIDAPPPVPTDPGVEPPDVPDPPEPPSWNPEMSTEYIGEQDDAAAWLFDRTTVHDIHITLDAAALASLSVEPYLWVLGSVEIAGDRVDDVSIRLRGKLGSFREIDGKPKWKFDFNKVDPERRYYGLEALALNNSVGDCSYLREATVFRVFELAEVPGPRVGFAHVRMNGEDYGLYQIMEFPDDRFLKRAFADGTGNLYDGKYLQTGWLGFEQLDFVPEKDELMVLEEGTDVGHADVIGVTEAIARGRGRPTYMDETSPVIDWEHTAAFLATEFWTDHWDGYALNRNNYRTYFDPTDGKAHLVPWDTDNSMVQGTVWLNGWLNPAGVIAKTCFDNPACDGLVENAVLALIDRIDNQVDLEAEALTWAEVTHELARNDPKRECSLEDLAEGRQEVWDWVAGRSDEIRREWGR